MFGDAIKAPTAMDVLDYNHTSMTKKWSVGVTTKDVRDSLGKLSDEEKKDMFKL